MSQITITINSREYPVACEDGQELHIMKLADMLDEKAKQLAGDSSQINESLLLAMVGLLLADEISEMKNNTGAVDNMTTARRVNTDDISKLDNDIAAAIKDIDSKIKTLAKRVNSL